VVHPPPQLATDRLLLTILPVASASRMLAFAEQNEDHLARWEPPRPAGYFTLDYWRRRLVQNLDERARDRSLRLSIVLRADPGGPVLGHCNYSNFVRGAFQACTLGYSLDHRWEGQGVMREALQASIAHVFGPLQMHRIMANYIPTNERSGRLLRRLGFTVEGYARDYLFIGGAWRDHVLTALTTPDPRPPPP
jgi:ribosomal-protein-alanine N-acetyltransferase